MSLRSKTNLLKIKKETDLLNHILLDSNEKIVERRDNKFWGEYVKRGTEKKNLFMRQQVS